MPCPRCGRKFQGICPNCTETINKKIAEIRKKAKCASPSERAKLLEEIQRLSGFRVK